MNKSGMAAQLVSNYYNVDLNNIFVIHDDIDLPIGKCKIKKGGGSGGHNGLRSLDQHLGTNDYWRIRIGIDRPPNQFEVSNYVLGKYTQDQRESIENSICQIVDNIDVILEKDIHNINKILS